MSHRLRAPQFALDSVLSVVAGGTVFHGKRIFRIAPCFLSMDGTCRNCVTEFACLCHQTSHRGRREGHCGSAELILYSLKNGLSASHRGTVHRPTQTQSISGTCFYFVIALPGAVPFEAIQTFRQNVFRLPGCSSPLPVLHHHTIQFVATEASKCRSYSSVISKHPKPVMKRTNISCVQEVINTCSDPRNLVPFLLVSSRSNCIHC